MNREIKFRGKNVTNGKWYYGTPVYYESGEVCIYAVHKSYGSEATSLDRVLVAHETVGQFTGLIDKNGKDIYEGDVVRFGNIHENRLKEDHEVVFHNGSFCARSLEINEFDAGYYYANGVICSNYNRVSFIKYIDQVWEREIKPDIEIIGNIHE